ncbi:MAG: hypothetical protein ACJAS9_003834 [Polaribacter sp.]|jgi:hypothetical protein
MHLAFYAKVVTYDEAIDGEIVSVSFQEKEDDPDLDCTSVDSLYDNPVKGIWISAASEFGDFVADVEWCDGKDYDGKYKVIDYILSINKLELTLIDGSHFEIDFSTDDNTLKEIEAFLSVAAK